MAIFAYGGNIFRFNFIDYSCKFSQQFHLYKTLNRSRTNAQRKTEQIIALIKLTSMHVKPVLNVYSKPSAPFKKRFWGDVSWFCLSSILCCTPSKKSSRPSAEWSTFRKLGLNTLRLSNFSRLNVTIKFQTPSKLYEIFILLFT